MNRLRTDDDPVASMTTFAVMLNVDPSDLRPDTPLTQPSSESRRSAVASNMNSVPNFLSSLSWRLGASFLLKRYPSPSKITFDFLSGD
jgi:hypothetical protein